MRDAHDFFSRQSNHVPYRGLAVCCMSSSAFKTRCFDGAGLDVNAMRVCKRLDPVWVRLGSF